MKDEIVLTHKKTKRRLFVTTIGLSAKVVYQTRQMRQNPETHHSWKEIEYDELIEYEPVFDKDTKHFKWLVNMLKPNFNPLGEDAD